MSQEYLAKAVTSHGIESHVRFGVKVIAARTRLYEKSVKSYCDCLRLFDLDCFWNNWIVGYVMKQIF